MGYFVSLNYDNDLNGGSMLNQALSKLPPNLREQWSMHTVNKNFMRPTLLDFNDWLKNKEETHERMISSAFAKPKHDDKSKTSSKSFAAASTAASSKSVKSKTTPSSSFNPCVLCNEKHPLWRCSVFKEKTPTQRAKLPLIISYVSLV